MTSNPPAWQMIKQAVEGLGGKASNGEIRDYIRAHWGGVKENTVNTQINICTVNSPSRIHYPENNKPRIANGRYDFLYRTGRGTVELYDPVHHGAWEIRRDEDGRLTIGHVGEQEDEDTTPRHPPVAPPLSEADADAFLFSLERHLRDFLAANIQRITPTGTTLSVYADDAGHMGVEYPAGVGPIDLLAIDDNGNFVVFELKLGRGPDAAVGQVARYMGWVKHNLAGGHKVSGVVVAKSVEAKLRYAASVIPDVALFEYTMSFALHAADAVSGG